MQHSNSILCGTGVGLRLGMDDGFPDFPIPPIHSQSTSEDPGLLHPLSIPPALVARRRSAEVTVEFRPQAWNSVCERVPFFERPMMAGVLSLPAGTATFGAPGLSTWTKEHLSPALGQFEGAAVSPLQFLKKMRPASLIAKVWTPQLSATTT